MTTDRQYLLAVLKRFDPDLVVIESCGLAGWVHDTCTAGGTNCWSATPARRPGSGNTLNAKPTAMTPSSGQAGRAGSIGSRLHPLSGKPSLSFQSLIESPAGRAPPNTAELPASSRTTPFSPPL